MTDYTKMLGDFPEINPANYGDDAVNALNEWGIAAHTAIEALQAECAEHKENAIRNARIAVSIRAERDQLQAKLDAMGKGEPVSYGDAARRRGKQVGTLWQFDDLGLSMFVGEIIGQCYAAPKALAPEPLTPYELQQVVELLDKEGHDGKDFEPECPLCTARQKLAAHGIGGTP